MKQLKSYILLFLFLSFPRAGWAGFHVGLGDAVAKRSAQLIDKAAAADPMNATGEAVAATLPSCASGAIYDSLPTDLSTIAAIEPLGHVAPSPHTFPSDHIYVYASTTIVVSHAAYAPGAIHVTDIASTKYLNASPVFTDYAIYFYACKEVKTYYAHIRTLSPTVQIQLDRAPQNCSTYSTGGGSYYRCDTNVNITLQSGDLIGYGANNGAFDFGSYDYRIPLPAFATPSRHTGTDQAYTVCPIDYFSDSLKSQMETLLGRFDGGYRRTLAPVCGQYNQDIAAAARGFWYHPGSPNIPEDPHLALLINNVYAPQQTISYGTSLPGQSPAFYTFSPTSSGQINRDFAQVIADGTIYCYDTFFDPVGQAISGGPTFLIQMPNSTTLKIEHQPATSCGSGPWAFTSNAVTFER